jgi:hypothetical protein
VSSAEIPIKQDPGAPSGNASTSADPLSSQEQSTCNGLAHTRELELLLVCARRTLSPAEHRRVAGIIAAGIDWPALLPFAIRHKLLPLLALHLRQHDAIVPQEVRDGLRNFSFQNARWVLQVVSEIVEMLTDFDREGILAVPYKGPVLGAQLYGSLTLRQAGDIDMLIRRSDVGRARDLLQRRGYEPTHTLDAAGHAFMVQSRYSEGFRRDSIFPVELHWAFTNGDIAFPLELDDLTPRLGTVAIGQRSVPVFAPEDLLLILSVHGSKHRWDRIEWLCGMAEVVRGSPAIDWDELLDRSRKLGIRRMLLLGLLLAHDHLQAPIPASVVRLARSDSPVAELAAEVPILWLEIPEAGEEGSLPTDLFRLRLRERYRDRIRFVWYRMTTPSRPENWSAILLGGRAVPLHTWRRLVLLAGKMRPAIRSYLRSKRRSEAGL